MMRKRPFVWIFLLFGAGIFLQVVARWPAGILLGLIFVFYGAACYPFRRSWIGPLLFALCLIGLGGFYSWAMRKFPVDHIHYYRRLFYGRDVAAAGTIVSEVRVKPGLNGEKTVFILDLHELDCRGHRRRVSGRVQVNLYQSRALKYGERIVLQGKLHRPYEFSRTSKFSYRRYLAQKGIYWVFSVGKYKPVIVLSGSGGNPIFSAALRLRQRLESDFNRYLTPKEAGLMQAIILGERSRIPDPVYALFKKTGTAHVLAISGLHVGIVAGLFFLFLKMFPVSRRVQIILTIFLLAGYALLTGGRPSVVRATVMASVFLFSFVLERETDSLNSLCLAGFVLLLINPMNFLDIGFQLSFTSVFAIILLYPVIWECWQNLPLNGNHKIWRFIFQALSGSLAAWLGVAGLIAYYFDIVTPVTVFANILIIPMISMIVALGLGLLAVGYFAPLAGCFAVCIKIVLNLMVAQIFMLEKIPGAYWSFPHFPIWISCMYYLILVLGYGLMAYYQKSTQARSAVSPIDNP